MCNATTNRYSASAAPERNREKEFLYLHVP
jgi:hypothetical protein